MGGNIALVMPLKYWTVTHSNVSYSGGPGVHGAAVPRPAAKERSPERENVIPPIAVMV